MLFMDNIFIVYCVSNEGYWPLNALEVGKIYCIKMMGDWKFKALGTGLLPIHLGDKESFNEYFRCVSSNCDSI